MSRRGLRIAAVFIIALILVVAVWLWPGQTNKTRDAWQAGLALALNNAGPDSIVVATEGVREHIPAGQVQMVASLAEFEATTSGQAAIWVLIPFEAGEVGGSIRRRLNEAGALWLDFSGELTLHYWRPGAATADLLLDSLQWMPADAGSMVQLAGWYDSLNMPEAAASAAHQAAALTRDRVAASIYERTRGNVWRQRGQAEQAVAAYRAAINLDADNVEALIRLGEQLLALRRPAEAEEPLRRAVRLASGESDSYWSQRLLGDALAAQGEVEAASENYQAAASLQPDEPIIYFKLGNALATWGDLAGAARAYERYLALDPAGPRAEEAQERLAGLSK